MDMFAIITIEEKWELERVPNTKYQYNAGELK